MLSVSVEMLGAMVRVDKTQPVWAMEEKASSFRS